MKSIRAWSHSRVFLGKAGSVRLLMVPGLTAGICGSVFFVIALGQSVSVFDAENPYLPFPFDKPDCRGFWVRLPEAFVRWGWLDSANYFVAFNRGRGES